MSISNDLKIFNVNDDNKFDYINDISNDIEFLSKDKSIYNYINHYDLLFKNESVMIQADSKFFSLTNLGLIVTELKFDDNNEVVEESLIKLLYKDSLIYNVNLKTLKKNLYELSFYMGHKDFSINFGSNEYIKCTKIYNILLEISNIQKYNNKTKILEEKYLCKLINTMNDFKVQDSNNCIKIRKDSIKCSKQIVDDIKKYDKYDYYDVIEKYI